MPSLKATHIDILRGPMDTSLPRGQYRWFVQWECPSCGHLAQEAHYGSRWSVEQALKRYPECTKCVDKHEENSKLIYELNKATRSIKQRTARMAAQLNRGLGGGR